MESVANREQANDLLATQIDWHHKNHVSRTTGLTPQKAVEQSISEASACWRPVPPPELLDLHLATHHTRVVQKAGEISFLGRRWEITPSDTKQVTIVQQLGSFRVIARPPTPQASQWPNILAEYRLQAGSNIRKSCPLLLRQLNPLLLSRRPENVVVLPCPQNSILSKRQYLCLTAGTDQGYLILNL